MVFRRPSLGCSVVAKLFVRESRCSSVHRCVEIPGGIASNVRYRIRDRCVVILQASSPSVARRTLSSKRRPNYKSRRIRPVPRHAWQTSSSAPARCHLNCSVGMSISKERGGKAASRNSAAGPQPANSGVTPSVARPLPAASPSRARSQADNRPTARSADSEGDLDPAQSSSEPS
jgi:hypothetical protein